MPSTRKTSISKAATLARVRENQRRCRARKRERMSELERKVQNLEAGKGLSDENGSDKMQRLERENQRLRALLEAAGLPQLWLDAFINLDNEKRSSVESFSQQQDTLAISKRASSISIETASRKLMPNSSSMNVSATESHQSTINTPIDLNTDLDFLSWTDMSFGLDSARTPDILVGPTSMAVASRATSDNQLVSTSSVNTCCTGNNNCSNLGISDSDTTLCSVAFELIKRCNNKGLDMFEISVRLWGGFRAGEKGRDDCTVNNSVLFEVLNYIAG